MLDQDQPNVFISGASRGIGLAIAQEFHQQGFGIGICARGQLGLEQALDTMPGAWGVTCDVSQKAEVKRLAKQILTNLGTPEVLINNAGIFHPGALHLEEEEVFEKMMATNLASAYHLTRGLLPAMISRGSGSIINVGSIAGLRAYPNGGSYSVSKWALRGFTQNLREELKPLGIRVLSILPGPTETDSWNGANIEASRMMPAQDLAKIVWQAYNLSHRTVIEEIIARPQLGDIE